MKDDLPTLHIRTYQVDGLTKNYSLSDTERVEHALRELDALVVFGRETIKVADDDSEIALPTSHLTRIDLITDRLSVWGFPFVLGALMELTEVEFLECTGKSVEAETNRANDVPVFLDITMAQNQRFFFWMEVVGGLPAVRLNRIRSMLKAKSLVFGLQTNGIGILNLGNLTHFSIHPEPLETNVEMPADHKIHGNKLRPAKFEVGRRSLQNGELDFIRVYENNHAT